MLLSICWGCVLAQTQAVPPILISPANGITDQPPSLTLSWNTALNAILYRVQVSTNSSFYPLVFFVDSTANNYSVKSNVLDSNTLYYWQVAAYTGTSMGWSSIWSFTTSEPGQLSIPSLVSPSNNANNEAIPLKFLWESVQGADAYYIYISTNSTFSPVYDTVTGGITTALTPDSMILNSIHLSYNTTYYWRLQAEPCCSPYSSWSSIWSFSTLTTPITPILTSPANGATGQDTATLSLDWYSVPYATSYNVCMSTNATFSSTVLNQTCFTGSYEYMIDAINGAAINTWFYWRVNASNAAGTGLWSNVWSFKTLTMPSAPTLISPTNGSSYQGNSITMNWSADGTSEYNIELSTTSTFSSDVDSGLEPFGANDYYLNISYNTTYYWRVHASNDIGTSSWSNIWSFTTTATSVIEKCNSSFILSCNARNGVVNYSIPSSAMVNISLFDIRGKQVFNSSDIATAGAHRLSLRNILPAGNYIVRFKTKGFEKNFAAAFM